MPVDFIDLPSGLVINEIFDRVNRNSRNLERQELRHARYNGWFISECENEADDDPFWERIKVTTKSKAKRMKNVQFVSELLLIIIDQKIVGFDQDYLDERYAALDSLEDNPDFDLDTYLSKKTFVKGFIDSMESFNSCITEFAKTANNLYTLFALVALEDISHTAQELASKYSDFMKIVEEFKNEDLDNLEQISSRSPERENAFRYFTNTSGASTDAPQRNSRYEALKAVLLQ